VHKFLQYTIGFTLQFCDQLLSQRAIIRGTMDDGNTNYPALRANGNSAGALDRALAELPLLVARALEIATPVELVDLRNRAELLRDYARKSRLGMTAQNACAQARLRLERRLGEVLSPRISRGRPRKNIVPDDNYLRLADLGISPDLSARAQKIEAIRPAVFERFFVQAAEFGWEITNANFFQRIGGEGVNEVAKQRQGFDRHRTPSMRGRDRYSPHGAMPPRPRGLDRKPTIRLLQGDCLDRMAEIPDRSIDLIATDLPYGTTLCDWDTAIDLAALWAHYKRIIKPYHVIALTANQPFTTTLGMSNLPWLKYDLIWEKPQAADFVHAKNRPLRVHETVLVFSDGKVAPESRSSRRMPYYPQGLTSANGTGYPRSVKQFSHDDPRLHPTAKPVALMGWLIEMFTLPGETVLDSCMGSGTTGIAAIQSGRSFIGIELDRHYFGIASDRLASDSADT
jgi:site-specific DNA-methyltransferase (adenine-specific)